MAVDTSWRAVGYYIYQRDDEDPTKIHYVKFNSLLMDPWQQRYSQPKRELCGLRRALEQEIYLFRGCRNFIVETDAKYLIGMLNNPGKMPNVTINRWVDYIHTNFFFEIVHKKRKTFGLDGLSRRKWYAGDPPPKEFTDGTDDGAEDIVLRKDDPQEPDPLELDEFYEEIDSRKGFLQEILRDDRVLSLEWQFNNNSDHLNKIGSMEVFTKTMEDSLEDSLETDRKEYDDNR